MRDIALATAEMRRMAGPASLCAYTGRPSRVEDGGDRLAPIGRVVLSMLIEVLSTRW